MASLPRREINTHYTDMRNLKWSAAEKAIARKAFDLAHMSHSLAEKK